MLHVLEMILLRKSFYEDVTTEEIQLFWTQLPDALLLITCATVLLFVTLLPVAIVLVILANLRNGKAIWDGIHIMLSVILLLNLAIILLGPSVKAHARIAATWQGHAGLHRDLGKLLELRVESVTRSKSSPRYYLTLSSTVGEDHFRISQKTFLAAKEANSVPLICYEARSCWIERDRQELKQYVGKLVILSVLNFLLLCVLACLLWLNWLELRGQRQDTQA